MPAQSGLDLTWFDAEAANLNLLISSPDILQVTIRPPLDEVSGAAHPRSRRAEGIGDKSFGGQCRAVKIASSKTCSYDVEFACYPNAHLLQTFVQDIHLKVRYRTSDDAGWAIYC